LKQPEVELEAWAVPPAKSQDHRTGPVGRPLTAVVGLVALEVAVVVWLKLLLVLV